MNPTTEELRRRAERGAAFLDVKRPDWLYRINVGDLAIAWGDKCVIGQLHGGKYYGPLEELGLLVDESTSNELSAAAHGFEITDDLVGEGEIVYETYTRLTDVWRNLVTERRLTRELR